ncbi:MAG: TetR/AcrR family transcriptional regulator [Microthrixaceae bacterium]|nr:TetR/AcrR family transcriptional regulator [Microthrixaceae bacterium]
MGSNGDETAPTIPTTPKGRRTRQQLLDAARAVFGRDGYVNTRMSDIALEANLSMGALYRYFANKDSIFEDLVSGIHEELFSSSRSVGHNFAKEPFDALKEANLGFLQHYFDNRDVMRTLVEAAAVDQRFRDIWWGMRARHVERFLQALEVEYGVTELDGVDIASAADAAACMVEQIAYVWFGHEAIQPRKVDVDEAAEIATRAWFRLFFTPENWDDRTWAKTP